jgi:predicted RNA-binding Zn ribbon-like protein
MEPSFQPAGRAPAPAPLDLVQDFVNTEIPEWHVDELATPAALARWLGLRGLAEPDDDVDPGAFVVARELRAGLRELALAHTLGVAPASPAIDAVGRLPLRAAVSSGGVVCVEPGGAGAERALAAIVAAVLEAVRRGDWERLKACRKDGCGWVFYDGSRNRSSSWCSMSICGNRSKTSRYRRRRSEG